VPRSTVLVLDNAKIHHSELLETPRITPEIAKPTLRFQPDTIINAEKESPFEETNGSRI